MPGHLTVGERDRLAQLLQQQATQSEIARVLGRSRATICRELKRNRTSDDYWAAQAQQLAEQRRRDRPIQAKMDRSSILPFVEQWLAQCWSPEQIAGRLKLEFPEAIARQVSPQTIYAWIASRGEDRPHWQGFLRRRGRRPKRRENSGETASPATIADRPAIIEQRGRLGDFEGDTVLGPPGSGGVVTLVDRQSRYTLLAKVPSKQSNRIAKRIRDRLGSLDDEQRRSLTFDNGTEFARCPRLEATLGVAVYFAEPGCPYQRGTNENTNGLLRQFFPKGSDFRQISHHEVRRVENLLNNRPRACLGYRTPNEVFHDKQTQLCCDSV